MSILCVSTVENQILPNPTKYRTQPESCYAILFFYGNELIKKFC